MLASAWHRVVKEYPESRLFLVGPHFAGTQFYQDLVRSFNEDLGRKVFLVGKIDNPEVYYLACDVFVFPSRNEGLPNALLEAMACGAACVATRIDGVTETILRNGHNGIVVEQENSVTLADALLEAFKDPGLRKRLGRMAARTINDKYRIHLIADKYRKLYTSILKGKHR